MKRPSLISLLGAWRRAGGSNGIQWILGNGPRPWDRRLIAHIPHHAAAGCVAMATAVLGQLIQRKPVSVPFCNRFVWVSVWYVWCALCLSGYFAVNLPCTMPRLALIVTCMCSPLTCRKRIHGRWWIYLVQPCIVSNFMSCCTAERFWMGRSWKVLHPGVAHFMYMLPSVWIVPGNFTSEMRVS